MMADKRHYSYFPRRLPVRKPDADLWYHIEGELAKTNVPLSDRLPRHHPDESAWRTISTALPSPFFSRRQTIVTSVILLMVVTASILFWWFLPEDKAAGDAFSVVNENVNMADHHANITGEKPISSNKATIQPLVEISSPDSQPSNIPINLNEEQVLEEENQTLRSKDSQRNTDFTTQSANHEIDLLPLSPKNKTKVNHISHSYPKKRNTGSAAISLGYPPVKVSWEIGAYLQPTWTQHISTINSAWYFTPAAGLSFGVRKGKTLFETGISFSRFTYDDRVEIEYIERLFLGTLITAHNWVTEEYIDEDGMPQTRKKYIVELIDIYDSTFVEGVADDQVRLSLITIPFSLGYRFIDNGTMFFDLNAGVDLMMIKGEVIAGNWQTPAHAEHLEIFHQFSDRFSLKWKYHFAVGMGYRITERQSVYLAPSLWWYPEKIENKETTTFRNPVEAGARIGVKWEL
jgi:hypothetical protein